MSGDKFIDNQRAEQVMVLNDTIALKIQYIDISKFIFQQKVY